MADAHTQAHHDQVENHGDFRFLQWIDLMIADDDGGYGCQRVGLVQQGIGCRNRRFGSQHAVDHVTKVENARNASLRHHHIVVIGISMDDGVAQQRQPGRGLVDKAAQQPLDQGAALGIGDFVLVLADHCGRLCQVPVKGAV